MDQPLLLRVFVDPVYFILMVIAGIVESARFLATFSYYCQSLWLMRAMIMNHYDCPL